MAAVVELLQAVGAGQQNDRRRKAEERVTVGFCSRFEQSREPRRGTSRSCLRHSTGTAPRSAPSLPCAASRALAAGAPAAMQRLPAESPFARSAGLGRNALGYPRHLESRSATCARFPTSVV